MLFYNFVIMSLTSDPYLDDAINYVIRYDFVVFKNVHGVHVWHFVRYMFCVPMKLY